MASGFIFTPKSLESAAFFPSFVCVCVCLWYTLVWLDIPKCIPTELWQSRDIIVRISFQRRDRIKRARQKKLASAPREHTSPSLGETPNRRTFVTGSQNCWSAFTVPPKSFGAVPAQWLTPFSFILEEGHKTVWFRRRQWTLYWRAYPKDSRGEITLKVSTVFIFVSNTTLFGLIWHLA